MKFVAEYIWLGGHNELRSKSRTVNINCEHIKDTNQVLKEILSPQLYEEWNYDGSSTGQATGDNSDVLLKPVFVCSDPFRKAPNTLVFCSTYTPANTPLKNNHRDRAVELFNKKPELEPWYGIEQEFFIMDNNEQHPTRKSFKPSGWSGDVMTEKQGQYYCSVGSNNAFSRKVAEQAYHLCLEAGLTASGMNAEVAPGQWEIQIGPCLGIQAGDHVWMMRYILNRVGEIHGCQINLDPKPLKGMWNGSGCHTNFSTKPMREADDAMTHINNAIEQLEKKHMEHMNVYGEGNMERMSGSYETANYNNFSSGVSDRGASIRIPLSVEIKQKGYLEDRRPASNMDPYLVTSKIFETVAQLNESL